MSDPSRDCAAGVNSAVWITVPVPRDAIPGTYAGAIRILSRGKEIAFVPVRLRVRSSALPETPNLVIFFGLRGSGLYTFWDKTRKAPDETFFWYYRLLARYRFGPRLPFHDAYPRVSFTRPKGEIAARGPGDADLDGDQAGTSSGPSTTARTGTPSA